MRLSNIQPHIHSHHYLKPNAQAALFLGQNAIRFGQALVPHDELSISLTSPKELTSSDVKQFEQTPIDAIDFRVSPGVVLTEKEKQHFKNRLLEVNKLILARRQFPNPSNIYNGSLVEMDGGLWGRGVGAEGHQEFPVCAEKSAICDALTRQSENIMDSENDNHQSIINKTMMNAFPKVNRIFHAGDRLKPCGECLDWMNSGVFFKPNTEIVRLYKEPVANNTIPWVIDVRQVQDLLPMSLKREISYTLYFCKIYF